MSERLIPFSRPLLGPEEREEVLRVLDSGWLTTGPLTRRFEEEFQKYMGCEHAVAVGSCTAAMHLSLVALGIGGGHEVITTPFTFPATANVIIHTGAAPVFVDVEAETGNLDVNKVAEIIQARYRYDRFRRELVNRETGMVLKGFLPVHYAGHPCNLVVLKELAEEFSLVIVEDAAHALGAELKGVKAGCWGTAGCLSFYPTKNITTGEGGMVVTNDPELAHRVRIQSNHGITRDSWSRYGEENVWCYDVIAPGFKYNMTDLQAALGIHQLARLPEFLMMRETLAGRYDVAFEQIPGLRPLQVRSDVRHARHIYPVVVQREIVEISRDELIHALKARGIGTSVHFIPLHLQPFYQKTYGYKHGDFPVAESLFEGIFSLPLYPAMQPGDVERIVETIADLVTGRSPDLRHARNDS